MSVDRDIDGVRHTLKLTWGGIRDIAKVEPAPVIVYSMIVTNQFKAEELEAVISAGLKFGGSDMTAEAFIDAIGLEPARKIAQELMEEYIKPDAKKPEADMATST